MESNHLGTSAATRCFSPTEMTCGPERCCDACRAEEETYAIGDTPI
jgi:hypothetical protein